MNTIIINTKKSTNVKFILDLVKRIGDSAVVLKKTEQEDVLFGAIINNEKTGELVSRSTIFQKIKGV